MNRPIRSSRVASRESYNASPDRWSFHTASYISRRGSLILALTVDVRLVPAAEVDPQYPPRAMRCTPCPLMVRDRSKPCLVRCAQLTQLEAFSSFQPAIVAMQRFADVADGRRESWRDTRRPFPTRRGAPDIYRAIMLIPERSRWRRGSLKTIAPGRRHSWQVTLTSSSNRRTEISLDRML